MTDTASTPALDADASTAPGWVGAPKQKDRIVLLDAARGLGVLGILPCNMPDFDMPLSVSDSVLHWPLGHDPASVTGWAVTQIFFQRRFVTLFSMMFGVSLFLVGGERSDKARGSILRKRVLVLLGIGLLHCFAIWWGDVLISYALAGLIMLLLRSRSPESLLRIGLVIFGLMAVLMAAGSIAQTAQAFFHPQTPQQIAKGVKAGADAIAAYRGGFVSSLIANAKDGLIAQAGQIFIVPWSLSLMCFGLAAYKWGVFTGEASRVAYRWLLGAGMVALLTIAVTHGVVIASNISVPARAIASWVQTALAPVNSLGYVALLYFALTSAAWRIIPKTLAPVGQMAFTNYLTQSIMMTALFYGGRGPGLYASVDRPILWAIVVAVWALQIVWSRLWLTYFTMGPLEWVWRRLYRGPAPLRRAQPGPPQLSAAL